MDTDAKVFAERLHARGLLGMCNRSWQTDWEGEGPSELVSHYKVYQPGRPDFLLIGAKYENRGYQGFYAIPHTLSHYQNDDWRGEPGIARALPHDDTHIWDAINQYLMSPPQWHTLSSPKRIKQCPKILQKRMARLDQLHAIALPLINFPEEAMTLDGFNSDCGLRITSVLHTPKEREIRNGILNAQNPDWAARQRGSISPSPAPLSRASLSLWHIGEGYNMEEVAMTYSGLLSNESIKMPFREDINQQLQEAVSVSREWRTTELKAVRSLLPPEHQLIFDTTPESMSSDVDLI